MSIKRKRMEDDELKKSLWHAFDVLDTSSHLERTRTSLVHKTKLRVLTNNLGHVLGVEQAETIWDKVPEDSVDFDHFMTVLNNNLLVGLDKNAQPRAATLRAEINNLCWMLCEKSYRQRMKSIIVGQDCDIQSEDESGDKTAGEDVQNSSDLRQFSRTDNFKLWKIFNFLSERAEDGSVLLPLRIDIEETERIAAEICQAVGLSAPRFDPNSRRGSCDGRTSFLLDFSSFMALVSQRLSEEDDLGVISQGIAVVHDQLMLDIVRKGPMVKYGNKVTAWKERWFVLTSTSLNYYASSEEKDLKGTINMCPECFAQSFPDKHGGKQHRFKLHTKGKQYELSAPDLKSKNEWLADVKKVVTNIGKTNECLQQVAWKERKKEREERRRRTAEEEMKRLEEREQLRLREQQLEEERRQRQLAQEQIKEREMLLAMERKQRAEEEERRRKETNQLLEEKRKEIEAERLRCAETEARLREEREALVASSMEALEAEREQRALVEARLREEEAQLEEERRRLRELEETKTSLEALVEEERALKRDEEIVRNLQSKILEEEFAKREELERLQAEQGLQLLREKLSRQELEEAHREQIEALKLAQDQLELLTRERQQADAHLKEATEKLKQAEQERQHMESKMRVKETTRLAGPLPKPDPNPFVTHRGLGAFSDADFIKRHKETEVGLSSDGGVEGMDNHDGGDAQLCDGTESLTLNGEDGN